MNFLGEVLLVGVMNVLITTGVIKIIIFNKTKKIQNVFIWLQSCQFLDK